MGYKLNNENKPKSRQILTMTDQSVHGDNEQSQAGQEGQE